MYTINYKKYKLCYSIQLSTQSGTRLPASTGLACLHTSQISVSTLVVPATRRLSLGDHAFPAAAPAPGHGTVCRHPSLLHQPCLHSTEPCKLITDADGSRVSIAIIRLCDSVCMSDAR